MIRTFTDEQAEFSNGSRMLSDLFRKPFDFWLSPGPNSPETWRLVDLGDRSDVSCNAQDCHSLCDAVAISHVPALVPLDAGEHLLGIPLFGGTNIIAVAIGQFSTNSPELLSQLAQAFLKQWRHREESSRLKQENNTLVQQVSQDFEELMLHRSIAEQLEGTFDEGIVSIAQRVLPLINDTVQACWLALIGGPRDGQIVSEVGQQKLSIDLCWKLIEEFREQATISPVVRNQLHLLPQTQQLPGIREIILVPVETQAAKIGWLLAVNRCKPRLDPLTCAHR